MDDAGVFSPTGDLDGGLPGVRSFCKLTGLKVTPELRIDKYCRSSVGPGTACGHVFGRRRGRRDVGRDRAVEQRAARGDALHLEKSRLALETTEVTDTHHVQVILCLERSAL